MNTFNEAYKRGYERGRTYENSTIDDLDNVSPLSGEWAGESIPELLGDLIGDFIGDHTGGIPDEPILDDIFSSYERGFWDAVVDTH